MNVRNEIKIINEDGSMALIDAIYWQAIKDYVDGLRYHLNHPNKTDSKKNASYNSAVYFLNQTGRGQYILKILKSLNDEQISNLIDKNGLSWSESYYEYLRKLDGASSKSYRLNLSSNYI